MRQGLAGLGTVVLLGLFCLLAGCGGGNGSSGISSGTYDLSGKWATVGGLAGTGTQLTLNEYLTSVTGSGAYQIEAGAPGTIIVTGSASSNQFSLTLVYSNGITGVYSGQMSDANHMNGTVTPSGVSTPYTLNLVRQ